MDGGLDLAPQRRVGKPQPYQSYIILYNDRVLPHIREAYSAYTRELPADEEPRKWLLFMSEKAKQMLNDETEEVRAVVEEHRSKANETVKAALDEFNGPAAGAAPGTDLQSHARKLQK